MRDVISLVLAELTQYLIICGQHMYFTITSEREGGREREGRRERERGRQRDMNKLTLVFIASRFSKCI